MNIKIIEGDCRYMFEVPDESIDLIFTSPPYFNVKSYESNPDNIGNINNFEAYLKDMEKIFLECYRVLKVGSFIIVNISDIRSDDVRYNIPSYYSILLSKLGFKYKEDIIWEKFVIITDKRFGVTIQAEKPRYFYPNNVYEHTFVFLKGDIPTRPDTDEKIDIKYLMENKFNNDVWHIAPDSVLAQFHEAPFPIAYAELIIKLYSAKGETVLDPFAGSGTVALVCRNLKRNSIGYEINPEYIKLIKERLSTGQTSLGVEDNLVFIKQTIGDSQDIVIVMNCENCGKEVTATITNDRIHYYCKDGCGMSSNKKKNMWEKYGNDNK